MLQAASAGDLKTMESLIGSDPAIVDALGVREVTPLHVAAASGQDKAVTFLLEHGADPLAEDETSNTPAITARAEGHAGTAKIIEDWIAANGG
jgi:ankyrin repeat protein